MSILLKGNCIVKFHRILDIFSLGLNLSRFVQIECDYGLLPFHIEHMDITAKEKLSLRQHVLHPYKILLRDNDTPL